MGLWAKSLRICQCLCDHGKQSVRRMPQQTGFSKRSGHRLKRAMARRGDHAEAWRWDTAKGRRW